MTFNFFVRWAVFALYLSALTLYESQWLLPFILCYSFITGNFDLALMRV